MKLRHHNNTLEDFTYNINKHNITNMFLIYCYM